MSHIILREGVIRSSDLASGLQLTLCLVRSKTNLFDGSQIKAVRTVPSIQTRAAINNKGCDPGGVQVGALQFSRDLEKSRGDNFNIL